MPLPPDVLARQQGAIFDRLGAAAQWTGVADPVRVKFTEADELIHGADSQLVDTGRTVMVRKSDVPAPAIGDQVQLLDAAGDPISDGLFEVAREPKLDRRNNWTCAVNAVA